jgi:hypothetical protein
MTRRAVALLFAAVACTSGPPPPPPEAPTEHWTGSLSPPPASEAEVVATVNGERIYAHDVAEEARARGLPPERALDELIRAELLAGEARRRGLADDADVAEARKRARVRVLLARGFEPTFAGPESVPQAQVDNVYARPEFRRHYDHDEHHTVAWVRVNVKADAAPDELAQAQARIDAVHAALLAAAPQNKDDFFRIVGETDSAVAHASNQVFTTARDGPAVPEFAAAAFQLSRVGEVGAPVRTPWGWDILYLDGIIPAEHMPRAAADKDIREHLFEQARRTAFQRWVDGLVAGHHVTKDETKLDGVQVDSLVGLPP